MNIDLEEVAYAIHGNAVNKGFWEPNTPENHTVFYLKQLAMVHSEVSEILEAIRKEKGESVIVEEMADVIIRLLDLWVGMQRDGAVKTTITDALMEKISINTERPRLHGVLA